MKIKYMHAPDVVEKSMPQILTRSTTAAIAGLPYILTMGPPAL